LLKNAFVIPAVSSIKGLLMGGVLDLNVQT